MVVDEDFIRQQSEAFLPHLLLRLADQLVTAAGRWYARCGVGIPPRASSTLLALDERGALGVTELAAILKQSHQLVNQWVKQLGSAGLVATASDPNDARRTLISLTPEGKREVARLREALCPIAKASAAWLDEAHPELFTALWRLDALNQERPFLARIAAAAASSSSAAPGPGDPTAAGLPRPAATEQQNGGSS